MTAGGLVMMLGTWSVVIAINVFCIVRLLRKR
jgi:hypothetical protein